MEEEIKTLHLATEKLMKSGIQFLEKELTRIRTGRANPSILDSIHIQYYGSSTPINQVGNVSVPDPQMIVITPWEKSLLPDIEKAILKAGLGITPLKDNAAIRLPIPPLTGERRQELVRKMKKIGEDARIIIRNARRKGNAELKNLEKSKVISEDTQRTEEGVLQKTTDIYIKKIDDIVVQKEKELTEV